MITSLQWRLSLTLTAAILVVAVGAGWLGFRSAYDDTIGLQDDLLMQVGSLLDRLEVALPDEGLVGGYPGADHESRITLQKLDGGEHAQPSQEHVLSLPADLPEGLQTVLAQGEYFRIYVRTLHSGVRIALSQETDVREQIAYRNAWRAILPFLALVPLLLLVIHRLVRSLLAPVNLLSQEIDGRRDDDLHAIATTTLPREIRPFVDAINRLLQRVGDTLAVQRRFVADAAHELRTPLTALSLQAERFEQAELTSDGRQRLARLRSGIDRAKALLHQLLTLARTQAAPPRENTVFAVRELIRQVLENLLPLAQQKDIEIGVDACGDARIRSSELELALVLNNLIDNAIRYTPSGGRIDIAVQEQAGQVRVVIADNGPGIPVAQWQQVFEPFYRLNGNQEPGSGLGLAIVKTIVERLHIGIALAFSDQDQGTGLQISLIIPTATPANPAIPGQL
ncbi:ATP-binding protein [Herbaspirillum sp. NPDC087042]|uniref:ATP-binding protein n=1 Tax=Herbaspirillum sp. NPDC087042 TaxID=3364004 RepID=UPI00380C86F6